MPFASTAYGKFFRINSLLIVWFGAVLLLGGCGLFRSPEEKPAVEYFPVYIGLDTLVEGKARPEQWIVKDRLIAMEAGMDMTDKLLRLADTLSMDYFNGLCIHLSGMDSLPDVGLILQVELWEHLDYEGPGSLPPYQSWYGFFQGSAQGLQTTIILKETFLQRDYEGAWIDGLLFFYQGDSMPPTDHTMLHGLHLRTDESRPRPVVMGPSKGFFAGRVI